MAILAAQKSHNKKYLVILNRRSTFVPQMTDINDKTKYNENLSESYICEIKIKINLLQSKLFTNKRTFLSLQEVDKNKSLNRPTSSLITKLSAPLD